MGEDFALCGWGDHNIAAMAYETRARKNISPIAPALFAWYDENARALPWRVGPKARQAGEKPDPYHVWLSEIMLQQTTAATVTPRYAAFVKRWPTVKSMAAASVDDVLGAWAGLGYYARARNLHACARIVAHDHDGKFPDTEDALRRLPGIGDYTAAAIAAIAFDRPATVVDGNIERVVARLFAVEAAPPAAKAEIKRRAAELWPQKRSGDFAQALMDLGAGICRPKAPLCLLCPLSSACAAFAAGAADAYPKKPPKKARPLRRGAVFALTNARGEMLFERRPDKGLLAGCIGLPGTAWTAQSAEDALACAPAKARWKRIGAVAHTFTHFHLMLDVFAARAPKGFRRGRDQQWIAPEKARVPTVMKKAVVSAASAEGK